MDIYDLILQYARSRGLTVRDVNSQNSRVRTKIYLPNGKSFFQIRSAQSRNGREVIFQFGNSRTRGLRSWAADASDSLESDLQGMFNHPVKPYFPTIPFNHLENEVALNTLFQSLDDFLERIH